MSRVSLNIAEISSLISSQLSDCSGAVLVGSAVTRSAQCVADIDITAFDTGVELGAEQSSFFVYQELPVHVVAYAPSHFQVVAENDLLTFTYIREIKKLLRGVVLFDNDGAVESTLSRLRHCTVTPSLLAPLVITAGTGRELPETAVASRLSFYRAIESMVFAWLHFRSEYAYSKPKWLLEDVRTTGSPALEELLRSVSDELVDRHDVAQLVEGISGQLPRECGGAERQCLNNLADTRSLVKAGRFAAAVFPLRMAIYQACELWANHLGHRYADLRDIQRLLPELKTVQPQLATAVHDSLLLREPVSPALRHRWEQAYDEFLQEWHDVAPEVNDRRSVPVP